MSKKHVQKTLLEILHENPMVSHACKKAGITRDTFYRWLKESKSFRKKVDEVSGIGVYRIGDMAESVIMNAVQKGDIGAAKFVLKNNHERYKDPWKLRAEEIIRGIKWSRDKPPSLVDMVLGDYLEGTDRLSDEMKDDDSDDFDNRVVHLTKEVHGIDYHGKKNDIPPDLKAKYDECLKKRMPNGWSC